MNKKVIYIFLLTTPLSGARWLRRDQLLEACGSVFESATEMSEFCRERTEQLHHCFSRKKKLLGTISCGNQTEIADGFFQVQIEAKVSFTSAAPHIKQTEANL